MKLSRQVRRKLLRNKATIEAAEKRVEDRSILRKEKGLVPLDKDIVLNPYPETEASYALNYSKTYKPNGEREKARRRGTTDPYEG